MVRVFGFLTSQKKESLITKSLLSFGVILKKDIVASVCEGASVNQKFAKDVTETQICLAHGIHLGVTDVLYKKKFSKINQLKIVIVIVKWMKLMMNMKIMIVMIPITSIFIL